MSSPRPWATPSPHWTCPSALRTLRRLALTEPSPGWKPNSRHYGPHLAALLRQNISYTLIVWSADGRPHSDTLTVLRSLSKSIARKRNIASAEVVFHRLHSSITLEIWRRSARQIRTCWPVTDLPANLDLDIQPLSGALFLRLAPCLPSPVCLARCFLVRHCPRLPFSRLPVASPALRSRHCCPWRLTILVPQGLGFGASLLTTPVVSSALGSQRNFLPFGDIHEKEFLNCSKCCQES